MCVLAIDQGTTSTKSLVIDREGRIVGVSQQFEVTACYPRLGCVEFDPHDMLRSIALGAQAALTNAELNWRDIAAIGLANQGETVIAFDGDSGQPVYPAISWQDRRGRSYIEQWREAGCDERVVVLSGLRLDPYFSASKLAWILDHVPEARRLLAAGKLRYGTSDAWLIWQLTGGRQFVSDASTASRTMLLDLSNRQWSGELLGRLGVPIDGLPEVVPNVGRHCDTANGALAADIPIAGICVDQQAALFGHLAFEVGQAKITYGTGCFVLSNLGADANWRIPGLLTSVGWQIGDDATYVLEGGAFSGGSLIDWLCKIQLAEGVEELSRLAGDASPDTPIFLVPAFSGLGAPSWSDRARGCWLGMDHGADRRDLIRSAYEAIAFSVAHIMEAMGDAAHGPAAFAWMADSAGRPSSCNCRLISWASPSSAVMLRSSRRSASATWRAWVAECGRRPQRSQAPRVIQPSTNHVLSDDRSFSTNSQDGRRRAQPSSNWETTASLTTSDPVEHERFCATTVRKYLVSLARIRVPR